MNNVDYNKIYEKTIALAGNPNVGKSTVFNELTGLKQHTGNWAGKTVTNAQGHCVYNGKRYILTDIPGSYSLMAHSFEEAVARDYICFGKYDAVVVVCDATCLERNLNLVLQITEVCDNVIVCINLMDEAKRKGIKIDVSAISKKLSLPVVATSARGKEGLSNIMKAVEDICEGKNEKPYTPIYTTEIEEEISKIENILEEKPIKNLKSRWVAIKLLENNDDLIEKINDYIGYQLNSDADVKNAISDGKQALLRKGIDEKTFCDRIVSSIVLRAEEICCDTVKIDYEKSQKTDRMIDKILTSKKTGFPIMILMLMLILYITITGANYPSEFLSEFLFMIGEKISDFLVWLKCPDFITSMLIDGIYRVLAWVIAVMLPPMAIFFPLFTLLEDLGYLPRIAFNLDKYFQKCHACGKQALTMCMGFGCNAVGVTGCRIIDSKRERIIAMLTNNFVPCNGRFPTLISIITMFFVFGQENGFFGKILSVIILTVVVLLGIFMTFLVSSLLSKTLLKGLPSSFTLELPPYRKPQVGKVIIHSLTNRTLFVLGRAVSVAAPAGLIIWLMANISVGDISILKMCTDFIDPFGRLIGMDGVILMGFILGFPANEIVIPIIIMAYMSTGKIIEISELTELKNLLIANGWTWVTAINTMLFSIMHWPCSTTLLTIKKESGSLKWTLLSFLIPTLSGIIICFIFTTFTKMFIF